MTEQELTQTIKVLRKEVEILKGRLEPAGTEYIRNEIRAKTKENLDTLAALDVINGRIDELMQEVCYRAEDDVYSNLEGQSLPTLSKAGMKQKHGQAVMTVSEMMQDELEPLPINTFE
tara:strand:+ start:187 stop:540 length:354 start_codon:yes stop_codon:yes gene_type:complete